MQKRSHTESRTETESHSRSRRPALSWAKAAAAAATDTRKSNFSGTLGDEGKGGERSSGRTRSDLPRRFARWGRFGWRESPRGGRNSKAKPKLSRFFAYFDLHTHASKLGCFVYGNHFTSDPQRRALVKTFSRLMELNCKHFSYAGSDFSSSNMQALDKQVVHVIPHRTEAKIT